MGELMSECMNGWMDGGRWINGRYADKPVNGQKSRRVDQ